MRRRDFMATVGLASVATGYASPVLGKTSEGGDQAAREYYELRLYQVEPGAKAEALHAFLRDAAIPAWKRLGIGPVGVFEAAEGDGSTIYVLLPHPTLESVAGLSTRLAADAEFQKAGAAVLQAPKADPAYKRIESSLMLAFEMIPKLEAPARKESRVYELRTYESHNAQKAKKKIEMFNGGGEIALFRETGMQPVFFGETLIGAQLPNLTYMITFDDMAAHDANWKQFIDSAGWKELSAKPEYKDTVSNITRTFLKAAPYSQV